uniref:7TM_GPCR_Srx domain-containing protein n=1 Tax=Heterorhabditis bacteriophora TaxID=37862 RepID=A0A1I7WQY8_HETBA
MIIFDVFGFVLCNSLLYFIICFIINLNLKKFILILAINLLQMHSFH